MKRNIKKREDREKTYRELIEKVIALLENQYEEHLNDSEVKPYLAVIHIRDMLIAPEDKLVAQHNFFCYDVMIFLNI